MGRGRRFRGGHFRRVKSLILYVRPGQLNGMVHRQIIVGIARVIESHELQALNLGPFLFDLMRQPSTGLCGRNLLKTDLIHDLIARRCDPAAEYKGDLAV